MSCELYNMGNLKTLEKGADIRAPLRAFDLYEKVALDELGPERLGLGLGLPLAFRV